MKKLYRSTEQKVFGGVCGGLGDYFNLDSRVFRVLFILGLFAGIIPPVILYLILWTVLPQNPIKPVKNGSAKGGIVDAVTVKEVHK